MSATSTFSEQSRAGPRRPDFAGRPGVNVLRHQLVHHVERDVFDALHKANRELGYQEAQEANQAFGFTGLSEVVDHTTSVDFLEKKFVLSEEFSVKTAPDQDDLAGMGNWLRGAQKQSDWMIYGAHCHESGSTGEYHGGSRVTPPDFLMDFAHWTIDHGCALFAGHGPHFLRGIEIYKNRPIFYSLGNFIFQNESVLRLPSEAYRRFNLVLSQP